MFKKIDNININIYNINIIKGNVKHAEEVFIWQIQILTFVWT